MGVIVAMTTDMDSPGAINLHGREDFKGFAYLDYDLHPLVAWNVVRGVYCSADCVERDQSGAFLSLSMATMLRGHSENRLKSEMAIEILRNSKFPHHVSRLRGVFVFDDVDSISQLWYGHEWGESFHDKYMTDVGVSANRSTRVDANWILEIMDSNCCLTENWLEAATNYWEGKRHPTKTPIWERIVEGWVTIWQSDIKKQALLGISSYWPKSLKLLEYSCNAALVNSNDGVIMAASHHKDDFMYVDFYIRLVDAKSNDFLMKYSEFIKNNQGRVAFYNSVSYDLVTPDFSDLSIKIPVLGPIQFEDYPDGTVRTNLQPPVR